MGIYVLHTMFGKDNYLTVAKLQISCFYEGGSICNENPFITPPTNALEIYAISQTKDQSVAVIMVHETLFYLSKSNKLQTF